MRVNENVVWIVAIIAVAAWFISLGWADHEETMARIAHPQPAAQTQSR